MRSLCFAMLKSPCSSSPLKANSRSTPPIPGNVSIFDVDISVSLIIDSMERILERYERYSYAERQLMSNDPEQTGSWTLEHAKLKARMEVLQRNQKHFMGEELDSLSMKELQNLEQQLDSALKHVRSRKDKALQEQNNILTKKIKEKEKEKAQQALLEQQQINHEVESSSNIVLPQSMQTLDIGCPPTSIGKLKEDTSVRRASSMVSFFFAIFLHFLLGGYATIETK
ncbi:hypothetical protein G4B88_018023 [Cannabis sativa]|uniref:K-box domain-containing protein n=1 Tax=Cannabis sativa TaxID=3483 RepID=A0A7J6HIQ8_CANSA|nr:hypothetical protein G4B88_018023 [Cannabis sativa]